MECFRIYLNPNDFDYALLNFFLPHLNLHSGSRRDKLIVFQKYSVVEFPHLYFEISIDVYQQNELKDAWTSFCKKGLYQRVQKEDQLNSSIFKGYRDGHYVKENGRRFNREKFLKYSNVTLTNLKILEYLSKNDFRLKEEIYLKALFVFIYSIGGYSKERIIIKLNTLINDHVFSVQQKEKIEEITDLILKESGVRLKAEIEKIHEELLCYLPDYLVHSKFSDWKFSYGMLIENEEQQFPDLLEYYDLFKNQLNLSDSESCGLLIILRKCMDTDI